MNTDMMEALENIEREKGISIEVMLEALANALEDHPWREWAVAEAHESGGRMPGAPSRWNAKKDMRWEPLRIELVAEVAYEHLQGDRFRHTARFQRWRLDRDPASCTYDQLEVPVPHELAAIFGL